jgi:hypothetical protein
MRGLPDCVASCAAPCVSLRFTRIWRSAVSKTWREEIVLAATWSLVGVTAILALTSLVAVITWRENRRREREDQVAAKILEAARKEFSDKKEVGDLKERLSGYGVLALLIGLVAWLVKKDNEKRD